jgi:hypothetical protein
MEYQNMSDSRNHYIFEEPNTQSKNLDSFGFLNESEREEFEERAAIMEYDGNLSKMQAEKMALAIVLEQRQHLAKAS